MVMDLGLGSNPNLHRAQKRPIQSADRSRATVGGVGQSFPQDLVGSGSRMFCDRSEKMMLRLPEAGKRSLAADAGEKKRNPTQLRNEAQLQFTGQSITLPS
jgi:hypothetical protein